MAASPPKNKPALSEGNQSFDDRTTQLENNVYGSDKGRLRLLVLQRDLREFLPETTPLAVLDAGCGLGMMSEWVARLGHRVHAYDCSEKMVLKTQKRLQNYPDSQCQQAFIQHLSAREPYNLVMCHAVLAWVENQEAFLDKLAGLVKPNGYLSLMFYNAWAREMAQMVYGNFAYIDKGYQVRQRVKLSPHWPVIPDVVEKKLQQQGFSVIVKSGVRIFYDIIRDRQHYQQLSDDIIRHELRISRQHPYWQMGRYVHFLLKKSP